ncbi:MAG: hypothetical protein Kow00121_11540 [Elainellaceae cyanobacterium]
MATQTTLLCKKIAYFSTSIIAAAASIAIAPGLTSPASAQSFSGREVCQLVNGDYHELNTETWLCLYDAPRIDGSVGVFCQPNGLCQRFHYNRRPNGEVTLELHPTLYDDMNF